MEKKRYRTQLKIIFDIMEIIRNNSDVRITHIVSHSYIQHTEIHNRIKKLIADGLISKETMKQNGFGKKRSVYTYKLTPEGMELLRTLTEIQERLKKYELQL